MNYLYFNFKNLEVLQFPYTLILLKNLQMKKLYFLLLFLGVYLPINAQFIFFGGGHQFNSGSVVVEERIIEPFTSLEINGVFDVYLRQDGEEKLEIEGDEHLLPYINVYQSGDRLVIERNEHIIFKNWKKLNLYISINQLEHLEINGVGDLICEEKLRLEELHFECAQMGHTALDIEAKKLDLELTKVGKVYLTGTVEEFDLENTSLSKIDAYDLQAQVVRLDNTSLGKVRVWAEKELHVHSVGLGTIYCKGKPDIKRMKVTGLAKIRYL